MNSTLRTDRWLSFVLIGFISFWFGGNLRAVETHHTGTYNTAGSVLGGLIVDGNVSVSGSLSIEGDLIIKGGNVVISETLTVYGDLIVTNTAGGANVSVSNGIQVSGNIKTLGSTDASILSNSGSIDCGGGISTRATSGGTARAQVWAKGGCVRAASIETFANGTSSDGAFVRSDTSFITVLGNICTHSSSTPAHVMANDKLSAGSITTESSGSSAYVRSETSDIQVSGSINTNCSLGADGYVSSNGAITAGSLETNGGTSGYVTSVGAIEIVGTMKTKSASGSAMITCPGGLVSGSIVCSDEIYSSGGAIDVKGDLVAGGRVRSLATSITVGGNFIGQGRIDTHGPIAIHGDLIVDFDVETRSTLIVGGDIKAGSYVYSSGAMTIGGDLLTTGTSVYSGGILSVGGDISVKGGVYGDTSIDCFGDITTKSIGSNLSSVRSNGSLKAANITTHSVGAGNAAIRSYNADIDIAGEIHVRSDGGDANVEASTNISASRIRTKASANGWGHVRSTNGTINVSGEILTYSELSGPAFVSGKAGIYAGGISTYSSGSDGSASVVTASGGITVLGDIVTLSVSSIASVQADGDLIANNISTWAQNMSDARSAYIQSVNGEIIATGILVANSGAGDAYVLAQNGINALGIHTSGGGNARIQSMAGGIGSTASVNLRPDISTTSTSDVAIVQASGNIYAREIITHSDGGTGYVSSTSGVVDCLSSIDTRSVGDASLSAGGSVGQGYVRATNISTHSSSDDASVISTNDYIKSINNISTYSGSNFARITAQGDISANDISTDAQISSNIQSSGKIDAMGDIKAFSSSGYCCIISSGAINAKNIETESLLGSSVEAKITSGAAITAKGDVRTKATSAGSKAYISATSGLTANNVSTCGNRDSYVSVSSGDIILNGNLTTEVSILGGAYVSASGSISANSIITKAPTGSDQSIKSTSGTVDAEVRTDFSRTVPFTLQNADLSISKNFLLNTTLLIEGTCTLRGDGNELELGLSGQLDVTSGSTLVLQDLRIAELESTKIRCVTDDATIWFRGCDLMLSNVYNFATGSIVIDQDVTVRGGKPFVYTSSQVSYIYPKAKLLFDYGTTFSYGSSLDSRLAMNASTSKLHFNGATLYASEDLRLTKGTVEFDNIVTFSAEVGKQIALGDGVSLSNNPTLNFFVTSEVARHGTLVNDNV